MLAKEGLGASWVVECVQLLIAVIRLEQTCEGKMVGSYPPIRVLGSLGCGGW